MMAQKTKKTKKAKVKQPKIEGRKKVKMCIYPDPALFSKIDSMAKKQKSNRSEVAVSLIAKSLK